MRDASRGWFRGRMGCRGLTSAKYSLRPCISRIYHLNGVSWHSFMPKKPSINTLSPPVSSLSRRRIRSPSATQTWNLGSSTQSWWIGSLIASNPLLMVGVKLCDGCKTLSFKPEMPSRGVHTLRERRFCRMYHRLYLGRRVKRRVYLRRAN
jgi:hypothetical protein